MLYAVYAVLYLFVFLFGSCIGSFLNVIVYRVPRSISFVRGRSVCPACGETLKPLDLIPVLSYLLLRGRCRNCGAKIAPRYLLAELFCGGMAVWLFIHYDFTLQALCAFALCALLWTVALIDHDTMTIPNGLVIALIVPAAAAVLLFPRVGLLSRAIGLFAVSVPLWLLTLCIPDCFGGGDIKLMAVCGFALGWQTALLAAFIAVILCGGYALFLLVPRRIGKKAHIAFGPYLALGVAAAFVYGDAMLTGYLSLFGL